MGFIKNCLRVFQCIFLLNFVIIYSETASGKATLPPTTTAKPVDDDSDTDRIPIGVVFDQNINQIQHAFKIAMIQHTNNNTPDFLNFQVFVDVINTADSFKLSRLVCNQFSRGVVAILAAVHPDSFDTFHSYANTFHMPFVTPFFPEKVLTPTSGLPDYAMSILPDYHKAVLDTVTYYGWKNVIYLYDSHDGMLRLQQLFKSLTPGRSPFFRIANVKRINSAKEIIMYLRQLEKTDRWSNKYVILDCSTAMAKETLIAHVRDVQLGRRNYHYLFSGLVLDDRWDREIREFGTINMTGFRLVDPSRRFVKEFFATWKLDSIAAKGALMYDAAHTVIEAFQRIIKYKPYIMESLMNKSNTQYRFLSCDTPDAVPLKYGDEIADLIKRTQVEGLSGKIRFTNGGVRKNFSLVVVRNTPEGDMIKVATWYDDKGFRPLKKQTSPDTSGKYDRNKTYIVVSIQEPPYFMVNKKDSVNGQDNADIEYSGFCADLAELIAEKLQINIQFRLSADGKYGNINPNAIGGWDGMVGELVRKEADMVIAPLIVTEERETVIDFSNPFLSFNRIGPKPKKDENSLLGFLKPLSKETWWLLAFSVVLVSVVMFVVTRFSPMEWRVVAVTDNTQSFETSEAPIARASVINEFSFFNSIWFSVGSIMQQGSEVAPRSISGRIVSTVWWFFTLIIVSSYTAYLASQLTITGMESPHLPIYNRLAYCPEDMDMEGKRQITLDREEEQRNMDKMAFIAQPKDYTSPSCEMLVSIQDPGIKDFAVAFPKGSKLRTGVNLALIAIRKEGDMTRLLRKHFHKSKCGISDSIGGASELTLGEVVGLFYLLLSGMLVGLFIALVEFCNYHRSDAAKANISIKTALHAKSRLPVTEIQGVRNTTRHRRRREQERGCGTVPGAYAGYASRGYQHAGIEEMTVRNPPVVCACLRTTSLQVLDEQQRTLARSCFNNRLIRRPLPTIVEHPIDDIAIPTPPPSMRSRRSLISASLLVPFQPARYSMNHSSMTRMRALGPRHIISRQRSRQILEQVQMSRQAIELNLVPYFTPANQIAQEETALHNSFTQV